MMMYDINLFISHKFLRDQIETFPSQCIRLFNNNKISFLFAKPCFQEGVFTSCRKIIVYRCFYVVIKV